jgi:DNA-directed RNA polymerase specialized sigma subunit
MLREANRMLAVFQSSGNHGLIDLDYRADPADSELRDWLVEKHLPLVQQIAQDLRSRLPEDAEYADLITVGKFGLISALYAYDPSRGVPFEWYCGRRIRGAIADHLRIAGWHLCQCVTSTLS